MDFALKAYVRGGRLVMDEPTEFPEGSVINMVAIDLDGPDDLDDAERAELHVCLDRGLAEMERGEPGIDAAEVLARLRAR